MARRLRIDRGGLVYHVLNRRVGRMRLFAKDEDYAAFVAVLEEVQAHVPLRVLSYCVMPNHWHLVLWPRRARELSRYMQWLTTTHMRRWHGHHRTRGTGALYQGRYKSFPVQDDRHLLVVCRYVERNALRAGLVARAEEWAWSSLGQRQARTAPPWLVPPAGWPVPAPRDWLACVNRPETGPELEALRRSVNRGAPFGGPDWQTRTATRLKLQSSLRDPWRPKTKPKESHDK